MSFEESYYESEKIWSSGTCAPEDQQRFLVLAEKIPQQIRTLLDVGCGNGLFLKHLADSRRFHFDRLCGTDRSTAALAFVHGERVRSGIDSMPFSNEEFEAVTCLEVLEHLPYRVYSCGLREISRVAGHYILITVPLKENLRTSLVECEKCTCRFSPQYHLRAFDQAIMQRLLDDYGFLCREVFRIQRRRVVPSQVEKLLTLLGTAKRTLSHRPAQGMPAQAVCPACGYSPRLARNDPSVPALLRESEGLGRKLRSLLSIRSEWRWIGALYERSRGTD